MASMVRGWSASLGIPRCQVRRSRSIRLPTGTLVRTEAICAARPSNALPSSGPSSTIRWVPGQTSVLPFSSVKSCDFTEENGSTEVWPGTHLIVDDGPEDGKALEGRAAQMASVRTNVPVGSLILRDLRTWHRGMPNDADHPRTMLAIVYQ